MAIAKTLRHSGIFMLVLSVLVGCKNPKDTLIPQDFSKIEAIKPAIEKLTKEEQELVGNYIVSKTVAAKIQGAFTGVPAPGIPAGTTIGKAIEEQRARQEEQKKEEAREVALKEKLRAEKEQALKDMRAVITVTVVSKEIQEERGPGGIVLDENLFVTFGYRNNSPKTITGVKGYISIKDQFGDEISGFLVSNDETIPAGESRTWTGKRSVKYAVSHNQDAKFARIEDEKYKVEWKPTMVVFADGATLKAEN